MSFIENQFVNFRVIRRNGKGNKYRWGSLCMIVLFLCFMLVYDEPTPAVITGTLFCVLIVLLMFSAIKLQLLQEHDDIGWLMFRYEVIVLKIGDDELEYAIDETTALSFDLRGYAGEPVVGEVMSSKKGYGNFVSLTNGKGTARHEVLITNKMKISILDRLIGHYRSSRVKVRYNDSSCEDSKNSLILRLLLALRQTR